MKVRSTLVIALALIATQAYAQDKGGRRELKSLRDKASYSFGMAMGGTLKKTRRRH